MKEQKEQVKTVGMGFVGKLFGWLIGIIFILLGLLLLYRGLTNELFLKLFLPSILLILSGFIFLPIFNLVLIKFFKIQFSGWTRFFISISLIIFACILIFMALSPLIEEAREDYNKGNLPVDENSPEAVKLISVSIGEVSLKNNLLSFDVITENKGNVQVSFQIIRLVFVDSEDKEVYSVDAKADNVVNLYPGDTSTSGMGVGNWDAGDYTVSASILDLKGNILATAERQFSV